MTRPTLAATLAAMALAGCTAQQQAAVTAATPAIITLADLAAANNKTVAAALADGALICQRAGGFVAVAAPAAGTALPQYASVINQGAGIVAQVCAAVNAVPVALPAGTPAAAVPVAVVPAAASLAKPAA